VGEGERTTLVVARDASGLANDYQHLRPGTADAPWASTKGGIKPEPVVGVTS